RATAKAIIKLLVGADGKRGRFFVMKRAAGGVIFAGFFQFYAAVYHVDHIDAGQQIINKTLGNPACHNLLLLLLRSGSLVRTDAVQKAIPCGTANEKSAGTFRCSAFLTPRQNQPS